MKKNKNKKFMRRFSFLSVLAIIVILGVGAYTGFIYWKNSQSEDELQILNAQVTDLQAQVLQYESRDVESTIAAKQKLDELQMDAVEWSKVIEMIRRTVPSDRGQQIVDVLSYSGAGNDEITLSLKSIPGRSEPYLDVANLIKAFDDSPNFENNFVPSIAASINEEGDEILAFNFGTRFVADPGSSDEAEDVPESVVTPEPSVPRTSAPSSNTSTVEEGSDTETPDELEDTLSDILNESLDETVDADVDVDVDEPAAADDTEVPVPRS